MPRDKSKDRNRHISEPFPGLFQVRIQRNNRILGGSFSEKDLGSRDKALRAARAWRDDTLERNPPVYATADSYARQPHKDKSDDLPAGVSRLLVPDYRSGSGIFYLRFAVAWKERSGKRRLKGFQVGPEEAISEEDELHGELTARAFREHWEYCWDRGIDFDPSPYRRWKEEALYPFSPDILATTD